MSELAEQDRRTKRGWATPGSTHDRLIKIAKFGLPALVGIILAFLALVPLEDRQESSFLLDKNKVEQAQERLQSQFAQYRGQDERGRPFVLEAQSAVQRTSQDPTVEVSTMRAQMEYEDGLAQITAETARYNPQHQQVAVTGPIRFDSAGGYQMQTRDVTVDLNRRTMQSTGAVDGQMPLGTFGAQRMSVDLPSRTVVLEGGARLHIRQGALRRQP